MTELFHVDPRLRYDETLRLAHYRAALQSIARNTCCASCHEAALVARAVLQGEPTMITVNGTIDSIEVVKAEEGVTAFTEDQAKLTVSLEGRDGNGSIIVTVPNAATGGLAAGPCRLMVESA